jgi:chemotaxis protein MotA
MFVIIGWVVAMACVFGVFIAHGGNMGPVLKALPFEMTTIFGAAIGAFLATNQPKVIKSTLAGLAQCFKGSKYSKARYMDLMALLYDILQKARREGLMAIEKDVEEPANSPLFQKYPEIDTHHHEAHAPVMAIQRIAGGLPAFGIVAAVLGVVNTMGSVGQPPAVLGGMIGSALVGTFLGILLSYAFAEPLAGLLDQKVEEGTKELQCIKTTLLASMQGYAPQVAIEFGRKVLFHDDRPSFNELEGHVKGKKK